MTAKHDRQKRELAKRRARGSVERIDGLLAGLSAAIHNASNRLAQPTDQPGDEDTVEYDTPVKKHVTSSVELKFVRHSRFGFVTWPANEHVWHSMIGRIVQGCGVERQDKIISAGFARIENGKVVCYGKSETLSMGTIPGDSAALAAQLGLVAADNTR
jgi:hypothetical protein